MRNSWTPWHCFERGRARKVLIGAMLCGMALATPASAQQERFDNRGGSRCQELERQLVSEWQRSNNPQEEVGRISQQLDQLERSRRSAESEANRRECYEDMFIFGRTLRRTPACLKLDNDIESLRRNITTLSQRRDALTSSARRQNRREDLVAELARNGCGDNYAREHDSRRRSAPSFFSLWEDEDSSYDRGYANEQPSTNLPFASYRTMCVRMCDGYYFPVSFSTLGSRFNEDEAKCKSQCAAPAELFVYKNPGEEVEQMVSLTGQPYNNIQNAWRHRKQYIKGCSCKPEEYSATDIQQSEQELGKQAEVRPKRNPPAAAAAEQGAAQPPAAEAPAGRAQ